MHITDYSIRNVMVDEGQHVICLPTRVPIFREQSICTPRSLCTTFTVCAQLQGNSPNASLCTSNLSDQPAIQIMLKGMLKVLIFKHHFFLNWLKSAGAMKVMTFIANICHCWERTREIWVAVLFSPGSCCELSFSESMLVEDISLQMWIYSPSFCSYVSVNDDLKLGVWMCPSACIYLQQLDSWVRAIFVQEWK